MTQTKHRYTHQGLLFIRVALSALLLIHGIARVYLGTVGGFGEFLAGNGIPFGLAVAWFVTVFELTASLAMALGKFVTPIACVFISIYSCGIWLVHWSQGWFVVGAGRGGMEYSVLIIACLAGLAWAHRSDLKNKRLGK